MQYLGLELFPLYNTWNKSQMVEIAFGVRRWSVGIYLFSNQCRFGRGWNDFVRDNNFQVGEKLKFTHVGGTIFQVCYDNQM